MEITVAQRAHRKFRRCQRYRSFTEKSNPPFEALVGAQIGEDETPIGIYENVPGSAERCIVITDRGLHVLQSDGWLFLPYDKIASAELEGVEKSPDVDHL